MTLAPKHQRLVLVLLAVTALIGAVLLAMAAWLVWEAVLVVMMTWV